jgi:hypothetical protein
LQQRLGTITLKCEPDEAIELFEWCATSVDAVGQANQRSSESVGKIQELQSSLGDIQAQLDELVAAKQEDEVVLLQKFRDLLNEKKVRIREQQKIITEFTAKAADLEEHAEEADDVPKPVKGKKAPKRKAKAVENESPDEDVDMTPVKGEPEDEDAGNTTEATASVASDDSDEDEDIDSRQPETAKKPSPPKQQNAPPPPRALPFQRRKQAAAADESDSDEEL